MVLTSVVTSTVLPLVKVIMSVPSFLSRARASRLSSMLGSAKRGGFVFMESQGITLG